MQRRAAPERPADRDALLGLASSAADLALRRTGETLDDAFALIYDLQRDQRRIEIKCVELGTAHVELAEAHRDLRDEVKDRFEATTAAINRAREESRHEIARALAWCTVETKILCLFVSLATFFMYWAKR